MKPDLTPQTLLTLLLLHIHVDETDTYVEGCMYKVFQTVMYLAAYQTSGDVVILLYPKGDSLVEIFKKSLP